MSTTLFKILGQDHKREGDCWAWMVILSHDLGVVPRGSAKDELNDLALQFAQENTNCRVQQEGGRAPGQEFSNPPWMWWFPHYVIVSQDGGRDV